MHNITVRIYTNMHYNIYMYQHINLGFSSVLYIHVQDSSEFHNCKHNYHRSKNFIVKIFCACPKQRYITHKNYFTANNSRCGIPYVSKFLRNAIFADCYVQTFQGNNFHGSRVLSMVFQNFASLIFANFRNPRKLLKLCAA